MRLEHKVSSKQFEHWHCSLARVQTHLCGKETSLGSNLSRRNHYIAEFIVRNFADTSGRLNLFDKERCNLYQRKPKKAFVENRRNVRYSDGGKQNDFEVEEQLSKIESDAAPVIRRIIESARKGDFPKLSPKHRNAWKPFFFTSLLRSPEHGPRILNELGSERALDEAFDRVLQQQGLPTPNKGVYDLDPQWVNLKGMARHNNIATFGAGLPPQVNRELERYAHQVGLLVGIIQDLSTEFILGSCAVAVIASQGKSDSMSGTWFPISYDVAIGLSSFPDRELLLPLGPAEIQRINNASYEQSEIIAARSQSQLRQFMQSPPK